MPSLPARGALCGGHSSGSFGRSKDHVGDAVDVDTTGGDVGRHRDADIAVAEILERLLSAFWDLLPWMASVRTPARSSTPPPC